MADTERKGIVVKPWAQGAIGALVVTVISTVSTIAWLDGRYVSQRDHEAHEALDRKEVGRIDDTLRNHIDRTALDGTRLAVIEAQLAAVQRQLEVIDRKLDVAAKRVGTR